MLNLDAYLARIGYKGATAPSTLTLRNLHRCHLQTVPFENLDIKMGRKISCDEEAFVRKIVQRNRGGFCYELNGAFAALLRQIGFTVTLLSARVPSEDGSDGPEFDHLTLKVDLEESWLADVGFGDSFIEPLHLRPGMEQPQDSRKFRIGREGEVFSVERCEPEGDWCHQYSFTLIPHTLGEFAGMCHYHQTSPKSPFTRKRLCTKATPDGRVTLADRKLIFTHGAKKEEKLLSSDAESEIALHKYFGIKL